MDLHSYLPASPVGPCKNHDHTVFPGLDLPQEPWAGCLCCSGVLETSCGLKSFTTAKSHQGWGKLYSLVDTRTWSRFNMQMFFLSCIYWARKNLDPI